MTAPIGYIVARELGDGRVEWWEGHPDGTAVLHPTAEAAAAERDRITSAQWWPVHALVEVTPADADRRADAPTGTAVDPGDPRAGILDVTGDRTHMHNRCHQRAADLAGLLAECRDEIARLDRLGVRRTNNLLRRIDAATTDNAREG